MELQETVVMPMNQLTILPEQPEVVFPTMMVNVYRQYNIYCEFTHFLLPGKSDGSQPHNLKWENVDDTPLGK